MAINGSLGSNSKKSLRLFIILISFIAIVCIALLVIKKKCAITSVTVVGSSHYTDEEIENLVMSDSLGHNSVFLYLKYHNKKIEDIPFVQQMDVEIDSPTSVIITVYEKAVAGYVEYLNHYMYFDKDGIIVESSNRQIDGIPFVTGLEFDHVVLYEPLPIEDPNVFLMILNITQLLNKYEIMTDRIYFDNMGNITLYFGTARVLLGAGDYIDEKINEMHLLLPKLVGYSGVLHMENYSGTESRFSFEKDAAAEVFTVEEDAETLTEQ